MRVLIAGGGVIGASIAYFLSLRGAKVVVVERTGLACAASGKSGGFIALDWCDGTPLQMLARRSFALHAGLNEELEGDWGYRRLDTFGGLAGAWGAMAGSGRRVTLPWLSDEVMLNQRLGSPATTAQVHPGDFTLAMMRAAEKRGSELRIGTVTGVLFAEDGSRVRGAIVDRDEIPVDAVVIAMGPWSALAARWLPLPQVLGLKGHSIIYETRDLPAEALFLEYQGSDGTACSPEIFPRGNSTTWVCAISSETPVPIDPAEVRPDPGAMEQLRSIAERLSPAFAASRILAEQACFRPVAEDGLPLIGRVPGVAGAYVATGHSVWGILNAPATGEAMAELILGGATTKVDLSPFDPRRLAPART